MNGYVVHSDKKVYKATYDKANEVINGKDVTGSASLPGDTYFGETAKWFNGDYTFK